MASKTPSTQGSSSSSTVAPGPAFFTKEQMSAQRLTSFEQYGCGVAGGLAKVITGHPFDTIKGRVQSGVYPTATTALRETLRAEGPRALYQGVVPPCISVGCVSGILFFVNARIMAAMQPDPSKPLSYGQMALAGGGAGAVTAWVLTPLDQIKIWMQIEQRSKASAAAGGTPIGASKAVPGFTGRMVATSHRIGTPQLYRGFAATTWREVGTFGIFFPANEFAKRYLSGRDTSNNAPMTSSDIPLHVRIVAAGTCGVLCWLPCYPIDQIKTRQQLQGNPLVASIDGTASKSVPAGKGWSMARVAGHILREEGMRGFVRGMTPCLLRAFPTYTAQFTLFDILSTKLRERHLMRAQLEQASRVGL